MENSILQSVKQMVGINPEDTSFDVNIKMAINTAITFLYDIGLSEAEDVMVTNEETTWDELLGGRTDIEYVKTYVCQKVRMIFDPPSSSAALDAMDRSIKELEWRLCNNGRK